MSPITAMSPWKFEELSASGSKGEIGSPRASVVQTNLNIADSPLVGGKYGLSALRVREESTNLENVIKCERVQISISKQGRTSKEGLGEGNFESRNQAG